MIEYRQTLVMPGHPMTESITRLPASMFAQDNLWVLLRDAEMGIDRGLTGVPQTVKMYALHGGRESIPLTDELQWFIFGLTPGLRPEAFDNVMDAYNIVGSKFKEGCWNAITREGEVGRLPKLPATLGMGGATVRAVMEFESKDIYGVPDGTPMIEVETLHPLLLPALNVMVDPYTEYRMDAYFKMPLTTVNGARTNPFPHNDGNQVFAALFSDYGLAIEKARCRKVEKPECPYV